MILCNVEPHVFTKFSRHVCCQVEMATATASVQVMMLQGECHAGIRKATALGEIRVGAGSTPYQATIDLLGKIGAV